MSPSAFPGAERLALDATSNTGFDTTSDATSDANVSAKAAAASAPLLAISGLNVDFQGSPAVHSVDLQLARGEMLALVGESGSGKSTIALAAMGLLPHSAAVSGSIRLDGRELLGLREREWSALRGNRIGMIFQEPMTSLNPLQPIGKQVSEALSLHQSLSAAANRQRVLALLDLVRLPDPARRIDHYPHQLSGGQRQRVMIAIAVACHPHVLIADEPTTALDVTIQAQILELIDRLRRELSMAVLLITHDLGVVGRWADRVVVMKDGMKVEEAENKTLFAHPAHPYTKALLGASLHFGSGLHYRDGRLPDTVSGARSASAASAARARNDHTAVRNGAAALRRASGRPLLEVNDLVVDYPGKSGTVRAVDTVSFCIGAGETLGLVGESGCGKSSLSRALTRLLDPTRGEILFDGQDISRLSRRDLRPYRRRVQMIFQDPYGSLNPRHTVERTLGLALSIHGVSDSRQREQRIRQVIDAVGLPSTARRRYPHEFSGGQRQRIGIARALVLEPELVICDEPVSALDVSIQAQVLNLLADLKTELGLSLLFISHDLSVVRYIADRVLVMQAGRIVETGDHRSIWTTPQHDYTRSLIDAVPTSPIPPGNRSAAGSPALLAPPLAPLFAHQQG